MCDDIERLSRALPLALCSNMRESHCLIGTLSFLLLLRKNNTDVYGGQ